MLGAVGGPGLASAAAAESIGDADARPSMCDEAHGHGELQVSESSMSVCASDASVSPQQDVPSILWPAGARPDGRVRPTP